MSTNKLADDLGELEIVKLVPCPNYSKRLIDITTKKHR